MTLKPFSATLSALPTTIFEQMSQLAVFHNTINLGQGFPDTELQGPSSMKKAVAESMESGSNQYPPMKGLLQLRQDVAEHSSRYAGVSVEADNVIVTVGATEALASAFLGLLNPGDEVICFQPTYDSYAPLISVSGASPVFVDLLPPNWSFDPEKLCESFNERTKMIVLNTPHNPTGKVFSSEELELIGQLCVQHNVIAVLDEVYEHLVFPGIKHKTLAALDGMADRSIRIGSAGKTFSFTDWKVGWASGPSALINAVAKAHQFLTFTVNSSLQIGVSFGLSQCHFFYGSLGQVLQRKRERLTARLEKIGFRILPAQGTYFLILDVTPFKIDENEDDVAFCLRLTREGGVTLIPVSAFYAERSSAPKNLARLVFCKTDEKLDEACFRLERYFGGKADSRG